MTRSSRAAEVIRLFVCAFRDELKSRFVDGPGPSYRVPMEPRRSVPPINVWSRLDRTMN